jgi:cytochrome b
MNVTSASPAEGASVAVAVPPRVLVWDAPVRVFHWLAVLCFFGAWITAESERWRLLHVTLGYTLAGLVAFRLVWGLLGTRHARFANFVRGPKAVARYLGSLVRGRPEHHTGHNPAGALAIVGLLALAALVTFSGWATYNEVWGEWTEDLHEGAANAMMALVLVHVAGVVVSSWLHRENLVAGMVSGRKPGTPADALRRSWRGLAVLMLAAVLSFWWWQWRAPVGGAPLDERAASAQRLEPSQEQGRRQRRGGRDD